MFAVCRACIPIQRAVSRINRCCIYQQSLPLTRFQPSSTTSIRHCSAAASEALPSPSRDEETKEYPQKIQQIVDQIGGLTLIEVSDLNELLKKTLNIQDAPIMAAGMAMAAAPAQEEDDEEEAPAAPIQVQTSFTVKLVKFDETMKVKLIKEIKSVSTDMNLVQAKKFVESVPAVIRADIGKDEADKLKEQVEKVGGVVEIE